MEGTSGDTQDFGYRCFGDRFGEKVLDFRFSTCQFRGAKSAFRATELFAFRPCRRESFLGSFSDEVSLNFCKQSEERHHDFGLKVRRLTECKIFFDGDQCHVLLE